ncbi:MAG: hypothetical protein QOH10_432, partial [Actinomycetota bacterium]|nr:hypothetical protein [Actinomycetota bacterium]
MRERARLRAGGKQRSTLLVPPGLVREIDPYSVGVQRSELASAHASGAPYVSREIDALLQKRIKDCWRVCETPLVVVSGPHTSGKSRTLWEALKRVVPNATVYAVRPPRQSAGFDAAARPVTELLEEHRPRGRHGTVIWIDDAHDHFNHGLDVEALRKLCAFGKIRRRRSHPLVVAVTLDARRLADIEEFDPLLAQELRAVSTGTELRSTLNRPVELDEAKSLYPYIATHPMLERLPELFAAADLLRDRYHSSRSSRREGIAVARAAITWRVAGMPPGIDHFGLHELAAVLLRQEHPDTELDGERFASALSWATRRVAGDASLVRRIRDSDQWRYVAANALVALWEDEGETVPAAAWEIVLSRATSRTGFGVGCAAYAAGELEIAERAFAIAAEAPGSDGAHAWFGLGVVRTRDGDLAGAAAAYEQAIKRGTPVQAARAGLNVSWLRGEPSAIEDETDASPEAVETDSREAAAETEVAPDARREPGDIEEEVGDIEVPGDIEAEVGASEHEVETDSAEAAAHAAVELGRTRQEQGDIDGAVAAYQTAIDSGITE